MMVDKSRLFNIGPMSSVAGAIASFAVLSMAKAGASYAMVENGGDISMINDRTVLVGIYSGQSPVKNLALQIPARDRPLGICTSSGTVGPSISFGWADAATVVANDAALADCAATALGNAVTRNGPLEGCFDAVISEGVIGALVIRGPEIAVWGNLPRLVKARIDPELITKG